MVHVRILIVSILYNKISFAHNIHKTLTHVGIQKIHDRCIAGLIKCNYKYKLVQNSFLVGYDDKIGIFDLDFTKKNEVQVIGKVTKIINFGNKVFCVSNNQITSFFIIIDLVVESLSLEKT